MADTQVKNLIINKLTKAQYDALAEKDPTQLYFVTDSPAFQEPLIAGEGISIIDNVISATSQFPEQKNNVGKVLMTNGNEAKWENVVLFKEWQ